MVRDTIARLAPTAVLIEGPADFNERLAELQMPHVPPIAIYSYVAWEDGSRQGAYYPLCEHSPEWQALTAAAAIGAAVRFIDLPFAVLAREDRRTHRYGDGRLRGSDYVSALCSKLHVESFDDAWDLIAEIDPHLTTGEIQRRAADFCRGLREADEAHVSPADVRRERFMAAHIRAAVKEHGARGVVVVTGGYHTPGLERLLAGPPDDSGTAVTWPAGLAERGIALTPYSFERLDSLAGYEAGMPSPGFYHQAWRSTAGHEVHVPLLTAVVARLRERRQTASTADLIGIEACARGLAALRGHTRVWRNDLADGITSALLKDDVHHEHPFIMALQEVLRGGERGRLADGAPVPPLVRDIRMALEAANLVPAKQALARKLALAVPADLKVSRLLHRLRVLAIPGFTRLAGVDFVARDDLTALEEVWRVLWTPEQEAQMIEASRYGSALHEATGARLAEAAQAIDRSAARIALLLLDAVLAEVMSMAEALRARAAAVINADSDLASVAAAMDHLLYLFAWDDALGTRGSLETGALLATAFARALWLLESGGVAQGGASADVEAVRLMRGAFEKAHEPMRLDLESFAAVLERVQADGERSPALRGACAGALWSLQRLSPDSIHRQLLQLSSPQSLGDFLTGLFALAREEAQEDARLLAALRALVAAWDDDSFLAALPSLRLAFMYFTAREKANLARTLFAGDGGSAEEPVPLAVSTHAAAHAMAFERLLAHTASQYGVALEGGS
jgi:hypothetical protein